MKPLRACLVVLLFFAVLADGASARSAYVLDAGPTPGEVSVIDTATNTVVPTAIKVGSNPIAIAITPDGRTAYVANLASNDVSVIDTATNTASPTRIPVGVEPLSIAITPDGKRAYVVNVSGSVSVIDTATNTASSTPIPVGGGPADIAITPDGKTAYVVNGGTESVSVIDTASNTVSPTTIKVGVNPLAIAITPDGRRVYVANAESNDVSVIDTATNTASPTRIPVGVEPTAIAITPDGKTAYVANEQDESVSVIDTATNTASSTVKVGPQPHGIAITPDGKAVYVAIETDASVSVITTATNTAGTPPIKVGKDPQAVAIVPDQAPHAAFSAALTRARPGVPVSLDASASKDPETPIASYAWSFGDGQSQALGAPVTTHVFDKPGTYTVSLKTTDAEGCSSSSIFTGQTALCAGNVAAQATGTITVAYPGVGVRCPKKAGRRGCSFKLQAVAKRRKPAKAQSAIAKVKAKAGRPAIVTIVPKPAFAAKLATAKKILVKETVLVNGMSRTRYVKLAVVR